mmetsp:Transcript_5238/g.12747  ORF Transcript_5238/g.12747 Transcript_5238/m.12747 type:complete len:181 (-) Transcript_5238:44-586(-)
MGRGDRYNPYGGGGNSGVYNSYGQPVRNAEAYAATGAPTFTRAGNYVSNPVAYSGAIEASVRQNTDSPKYLYHYTDTSSASNIQQSGYVKQSTSSSDCALGQGVYLTAKAPRASSQSLLSNNYAAGASARGASKVESYVRVDADRVRSNLTNGRDALGRDVFLHKGDLDLGAAGGKVGKR